MRRFVTSHIPDVGEFVQLDEEVSHHLLRVTGIAPGEQVELLDGAGVVAIAELIRARAAKGRETDFHEGSGPSSRSGRLQHDRCRLTGGPLPA